MPFAENNGVRLHWQEKGQGSVVLLIMGHRYSSALWYSTIPALAADHRVIWFDNRGTGESASTPRVTLPEMASDALAVLKAASVERAHVFGVSMGGGVALELALQEPQRVISLVLGCTGIMTADKPRMPAVLRILYRLPSWTMRLLLPKQLGDKSYGSAATRELIAADRAIIANDKSNLRGIIAQASAVASYSVTKEKVATLAVPALVLHGDEDTVVPFDWGVELAEILPNSRLVRLEGAGHSFMVAAGAKANKALINFLREVDQRS